MTFAMCKALAIQNTFINLDSNHSTILHIIFYYSDKFKKSSAGTRHYTELKLWSVFWFIYFLHSFTIWCHEELVFNTLIKQRSQCLIQTEKHCEFQLVPAHYPNAVKCQTAKTVSNKLISTIYLYMDICIYFSVWLSSHLLSSGSLACLYLSGCDLAFICLCLFQMFKLLGEGE